MDFLFLGFGSGYGNRFGHVLGGLSHFDDSDALFSLLDALGGLLGSDSHLRRNYALCKCRELGCLCDIFWGNER